MTEKDWQRRVCDLAAVTGWRVMHVYPLARGRGGWRTATTSPGWPDLTLVKGGRLIFAELKAESGTVTSEQGVWLSELAMVGGVETFVWKPSDWPAVQAVLTARSAA